MMIQEGCVIISADAAIREEMRRSVESAIKVVGNAPDYQSGHMLVTDKKPAVLFVDLSQDPEKALAIIEQLKVEQPELNIFALGKKINPELILKAVRLGVRDFYALPEDREVVERTIRSICKEQENGAKRGRVISVFSLLGGCGATTLATNLAGYLARSPKQRSILFDLDLYKGDVSYFLNLEANFTITDFIQNISRVDGELLDSSLAKHASGLSVLGTPRSYEGAEEVTGEHVTRAIQSLRHHFDFIVVDCLKAIDDIFLATMDSADIILLVTLQTVPGLKNTKRCLELLEQLGYDRAKIKVVLNRFAKKTKAFSVKNIEKTLNWPIAATLCNMEQETMEAINTGRLLQEAYPKVKLTQEIASLSNLITQVKPAVVQRRSGLLSFLKKRGGS
jgi:pilus assembly protein CpaE